LVTSKLSPAQFIFTEEQSKTLKSILCFLLAVFPLSFIFWNKEKKIYFFVSAGLFAALLISKNYLAAAISSTVFAVYIFTIRNSLKIKTSIAMIPLILTAAAELFFLFKTDFFLQIFKSWQNAFPVIKNNFLFGTGFGNYNSYADYFSAGVNGNFSGPKNIFLEILAGCGIFSFMFFTLIVVIFFVSIFKKIKNENNGHLIPILLSVCSFLIFSFFNNSFVSTNILLFFFLISYISPMISFELRTKKISSNAVIFLSIPLVFSLGLQLYARQSYKNGMFLLAKEKYLSAEQYFKTAGVCDPLAPNYYCKLADVYFEKYRTAKNEKFLDRAISLANEAVKLNKFDGRGYYQLAWLYKYKNFYREAVENIKIAMKYEPSNTVYIQAFKDIADPLFFERTFNEERELHVKVV
jgi:tetratricopeptide (TPR) repeat protein